MEEYKRHIDDLFKEALDGNAEVPPTAVWDALEQRLDGNEKRRRGFFFRSRYIITVAALLLALAGIGGGMWLQDNHEAGDNNGTTKSAQTINAEKNKGEVATAGNDVTTDNKPANDDKEEKQKATTEKRGVDPIVIKEEHTERTIANREETKEETKANETLAKANDIEQDQSQLYSAITPEAGNNDNAMPQAPLPAYVEKSSKKHNIGVTETGLVQPVNGVAYAAKKKQEPIIQDAPEQQLVKANVKMPLPANAEPRSRNVHEETIMIPQSKSVVDNKNENKQDNVANAKSIDQHVYAANAAKDKPVHKKVKKRAEKKVGMAPEKIAASKTVKTERKTTPAKAAPVVAMAPVRNNVVAGKTYKAKKIKPATAAAVVVNAKATPGKMVVNKKPVIAKQTRAGKNNVIAAANKQLKGKQKSNKNIGKGALAKNVHQLQPMAGNEVPEQAVMPVPNTPPPVVPMAKAEPTAPVTKDAVANNTTTVSAGGASAGGSDTSNKKIHRPLKIAAGVKVGYEGGFNSDASKKVVVAPYLEYSISKRFSVMTQPAIKATQVSNLNMGGASYYKVNNDAQTSIDSTPIVTVPGYYIVNYHYTQSHDSIVKSYIYGGKYVEVELPILLKYKISPTFSVYGGVNINYSRFVKIDEKTLQVNGIQRTGDSSNPAPTQTPYALAPPPVSAVITYEGKPLSSYNGPLYQGQNGGVFRLGYMVGVSYEFSKRWTADLLIQQSAAKQNVVAGYDLNKPLSLPYFRFMIGYRLSDNLFNSK